MSHDLVNDAMDATFARLLHDESATPLARYATQVGHKRAPAPNRHARRAPCDEGEQEDVRSSQEIFAGFMPREPTPLYHAFPQEDSEALAARAPLARMFKPSARPQFRHHLLLLGWLEQLAALREPTQLTLPCGEEGRITLHVVQGRLALLPSIEGRPALDRQIWRQHPHLCRRIERELAQLHGMSRPSETLLPEAMALSHQERLALHAATLRLLEQCARAPLATPLLHPEATPLALAHAPLTASPLELLCPPFDPSRPTDPAPQTDLASLAWRRLEARALQGWFFEGAPRPFSSPDSARYAASYTSPTLRALVSAARHLAHLESLRRAIEGEARWAYLIQVEGYAMTLALWCEERHLTMSFGKEQLGRVIGVLNASFNTVSDMSCEEGRKMRRADKVSERLHAMMGQIPGASAMALYGGRGEVRHAVYRKEEEGTVPPFWVMPGGSSTRHEEHLFFSSTGCGVVLPLGEGRQLLVRGSARASIGVVRAHARMAARELSGWRFDR